MKISKNTFSENYWQLVKIAKEFHETNKSYSGGGTLAYSQELKQLAEKYKISTLLDYGCGKGLHYIEGSPIYFTDQKLTFDKYLGVSEVYKFDPAVEEFSNYPLLNSKFDATIAIQSLGNIPEEDFLTVVNHLMKMTEKFCFVGISLKPGKIKKNPNPADSYKLKKEWWEEQFKNWQGSELILRFIE